MKTTRIMVVITLCFLFNIANAQEILIAAQKQGKWGYIDTSGKFVIPAQFEDAYPFLKNTAVAKEKGLFGVIDTKGKWIVSPRKGAFNGDINSNRIVLTNDLGKWGAIDATGKEKIPYEYDAMSTFQSGFVLAGRKTASADLYSVVVLDTLGQAVISFDNIYLPVKSFSERKKVREGYTSVLVDGTFQGLLSESSYKLDGRTLYFGLLDVKNKKLISAKVNSMDAEVREGRLNLSSDGIAYSWSVPLSSEPSPNDAKFKVLANAIYSFSGGIAAIDKNGKWAYVDKDGSLLAETNLPTGDYVNENAMYFGGFVIFKKSNGAFIFTDLNGNQKIALEFDAANPFQYGFALVRFKGKWGLLQKDGSWAVPADFDDLRF